MLRNSPLRLERISSRESSTRSGQGALLTLDQLTSSNPQLSLERLRNIPDDQYVCFWAECVWFDPSKATRIQVENVKKAPASLSFLEGSSADSFMVSGLYRPPRKIDGVSKIVEPVFEGSAPDVGSRVFVDSVTHEVIGRMKHSPWYDDSDAFGIILMAEKYEKATVLEVKKRDGVCQRRGIGSMKYASWRSSQSVREIIVLN